MVMDFDRSPAGPAGSDSEQKNRPLTVRGA